MKKSDKKNQKDLILERECACYGVCSKGYINNNSREISHFGLKILNSNKSNS